MEAELEKVSIEIDEAIRCLGAGLDDEGTDHLVEAANMLDTLIGVVDQQRQAAMADEGERKLYRAA